MYVDTTLFVFSASTRMVRDKYSSTSYSVKTHTAAGATEYGTYICTIQVPLLCLTDVLLLLLYACGGDKKLRTDAMQSRRDTENGCQTGLSEVQ